jgi:APA family basic amino acid/polyamine antiporter
MSVRKIGTVPLCGMMIGAVLGSGIIILPPLARGLAGAWAVPAWGLVAAMGLAFAWFFSRLGVLFPGEGGAAEAVARALGPGARRLCACALIGAVLFGPAAVLLTIVDCLPPEVRPGPGLGRCLAALAALALCLGLHLAGLRAMSRVSLVLAGTSTALLLAGSLAVLAGGAPTSGPLPGGPLPDFEPGAMGQTLLLLFWAVVGWEVVGNFGAEVRDPRRTVPRAACIAAVLIGLTDVAVAAALEVAGQRAVGNGSLAPGGDLGVAALLVPLFGRAAPWVMAGLTLALCLTTILTFVGAVARLMASLAREGVLPRLLDRRNARGVPVWAVLGCSASHAAQVGLAGLGWVDVGGIVAVADGFFLVNALVGTLAAMRLFPGLGDRAAALALSLGLAAVLAQSGWPVLAAAGGLALWSLAPRDRSCSV